jgi:RHS repeat-associated protein
VYESFTYTPTGQRASATDARGVTTYSYDLRDRLLDVTHPDGATVEYTYDARGNRTSVAVSSGTTTYAYDALNRPVAVTDPDSGVTTYTYDAAGNRLSVAYPNGTETTYTYDALNRLTLMENRRADTSSISSYAYTLGPAGNRLSVTEGSGRVVDYTYDAVYRLTGEYITDAVLGNETITYTYDPAGNRLTKTDSGGTVTYAYDDNDRLVSETGITYTYDGNGNTLTKTEGSDTTTYDYDVESRLIGAVTPTETMAYAYDVDGIRVSATVNGTATRFLVDHNRDYAQVLEERDGVGALIVSYIYGDDLISQERGSVRTYYHYDGQMSTRQLTDATEAIVNTYVYDAFGILLDQAGAAANNYMYTGEQYDPNVGFYYLRARYYNQENGRFITRDPAKGNPFDPVTLHKYLYANANPLRYLDPSGEMSLVNVMVTVAIVGILASVAYASFFHLLSIMHTPVRWEGILMYGGGGAGVGASGFWTRLESDCYNGKKANGHYLMAAAGGMLGPLPVGMGVGFVSLITPGMFGPKPWTLIGTFSWMSATAAWGIGLSYTAFYMGMGIGEIGILPGVAFGIDVGLVALGGISIPIYMSDQIDC